MADRWMTLPTTTNDNGGTIPKHVINIDGIDGWSGNIVTPKRYWGAVFSSLNDHYCIHVYGTESALDELGAKSDVVDLSQVANTNYWVATIFNDSLNKDRTADEWQNKFKINPTL